MAKEIKIIVIDPKNQSIKEHYVKDDFRSIQKIVGGLIEYVQIAPRELLIINEEGLFKCDRNYRAWFKGIRQPMIGTMFICGYLPSHLTQNDEGDEETDTSLTVEQVTKMVRFRSGVLGSDELEVINDG